MKYRITDTAYPDEDMILELAPQDEWYDEVTPELNKEQAEELLDWWATPPGRGFMPMEDDDRFVVVDASSGEPNMETWSGIDDDRYLLPDFPFPSLSYEEYVDPRTFDDLTQEQGWNEDSQLAILRAFIDDQELTRSFNKYALGVADRENEV